MSAPTHVDELEPVMVRVSILGGHTQFDVGLPAHTPIAALLPAVIAQIQSRNPVRERPIAADGDTDDDAEPLGTLPDPRRWTLAPIGRDPLATQLTLFDAGIRDGELLALRPVRVGDSPVLFDDVIDALAELSSTRFRHWSPDAARTVGFGVALIAGALGALTLVVGYYATPSDPRAWWPAPLAALWTAALLVAAALVRRHRADPPTSAVACWAALIFAAATGATLAPGPASATTVVLSAAMVLVVAAVSHRVVGTSPAVHAATTTAALIVGLAALCQVFIGTVADVAAVTAAVGVGVVLAAPRLTSILAKLPLPSVPTAGEQIDAADVVPTAIEGIGAVGTVPLPKLASLTAKAVVAHAYLTGITVGAGLVAAIAAVIAATPWLGVAPRSACYAVIIAAVLVLRGRSHTDLTQAGALILAGAGVLGGQLVGCLIAGGAASPSGMFIVFCMAATFFGSAVVFGVVAPRHDFSPVLRRAAELVEYLLVVTIVPLLLWLLDLYQIVRSLR